MMMQSGVLYNHIRGERRKPIFMTWDSRRAQSGLSFCLCAVAACAVFHVAIINVLCGRQVC
jgi:hypothetical protein